ncbi:Holliday junction resolvase RecU [Neobacillus thermocopriae]|uniref:Holliday junction resolvase RecU n=1 Tax=Neobacillus thermocopriae TaxID=1215031 RepID=A0A6B3TSS8_9BACI|nr:Holliday junction resolvase RecU [Neobacillus thermocopriae]MED3625023.1 Holliday junction resolvase RecU [Neobacillus thermocopriae]MED3712779.1 Holliday junction resolvase RecU [Neobacillus thermocopriae]NEX79883.1 Holliday junction resolvase RecU [Neobacillus thermocopriae]
MNYPNGKKFIKQEQKKNLSIYGKDRGIYSNRGMTLEEDLNETNQYYREKNIAVIHKKPTPIQIVHVDYPKRSAAVIKEAYFKQASTTDYNGVYKGRYIDFEAKETKNSTSFPLKNFHDHQIFHMEQVLKHGGICFVIIRFSINDEIYLLEAKHLLSYWDRMKNGGRKSITKEEIKQNGYFIPIGYQPRIDYIKIIDNFIG